MSWPLPAWLGFAYLISELLLGACRRARSGTKARDANSLRLLWVVIGLSIFAAVQVAPRWRTAAIPAPAFCAAAGIACFSAGLILRWLSIVWLGRFFTVNVAIAHDHQLVESGPYRLLRHPSYTGALLAFLGFGLSLQNWAALLVILGPISFAFLYRIRVEERALLATFGDRYRAYQQRAKRLVPFIY